jgi:hypothetical protein
MSGEFTDPKAAGETIDGMTRTITLATLAGQATLNATLVWAAMGPALWLGAASAVLRPPKGK